MREILKHISGALHRTYNSVVQRPMPWRMIDKLASLEEAEERRAAQGHAGDEHAPSRPDAPPPRDPDGQDNHTS